MRPPPVTTQTAAPPHDEYTASLELVSTLCAEKTPDLIALVEATRKVARAGRMLGRLPERVIQDLRPVVEGCIGAVPQHGQQDLRLMVSRVLLETYFAAA